MKSLSSTILAAVQSFYEGDENSRIINNISKKLVKRINADGGEEEVPKRLLLSLLTELYANFKVQYPVQEFKIGRTKFGMLRPSNCLLLKDGKNEVCLCIHHENIRLLYKAIGITNYREFVCKLVCDKDNKT